MSAATTVTGTIRRPDGTPVTGTIEFVLSQPAKTTTPPVLFAPVRTTCAVTNGAIAGGCTVQGNDTLDPVGTYYTVRVVDSNNRVVVPAANYTIAGASVDLGTLPVTATATLVPPTGNVVGNLNVTGNLSVAGSANITGVDLAASHLRLLGLTADPATATDGSIFHRSDLNRIRFRTRGLQLFDGTGFLDINSSQPNTVDINANLKVGGSTQLGSSADLSCGSTDPTTPSTGSSRLYCLTGDKRVYLKNDTGTILGPLAALNQPQTWTAAQTVAELNNIRHANGFTGADGGAKIQACLAALPSTGGTCDARGLEGAQSIGASITIGENKTVLLGGAVFTVSAYPAFNLNANGAKLIGIGPGDTTAATGGLTVLRASGPTGTSDMIVVSTGGASILRNPVVKGIKIDFNNGAGAGRYGLSIISSHFGHYSDIAVFDSGSDGIRIEPFSSSNAAYFNTFENVLVKDAIGTPFHFKSTGEITYTTCIHCQADGTNTGVGTDVGLHGFWLETPAAAVQQQSIYLFTCIDCSVSSVANGNHGFFIEQKGSARVSNISYKGLLETGQGAGGTGTGVQVTSADPALTFLLNFHTNISGFASSHNLSTANTTQFEIRDSVNPWVVSSMEFRPRSGTLNELRFNSQGSGIYGLYTDASGGVIFRRVDTATDIFRVQDALIQPAANNVVSLGGPSLRWANTRTVSLDVASSFLPPASSTLPGSCTANREIFVDSDAAPAGQQLYLCNSAGNGWNLIGDGGGGSGDAVEVEDGDNAGTFTAIDTTARFDDSGDINFVFTDGGAGGPDVIAATVRADSVALTTDTTGNYVDNVTGGAGITVTHTPGEGSDPDVVIDLLDTQDGTGSTLSFSGLEFQGAGTDELALLQGCSDGQILKWDDETGGNGRWDCANDNDSGGAPAWNALINSADTATSYLSNNIAETFAETFSAAFSTGTQHKIAGTGAFTGGVLFGVAQETGNPTDGTLGQFLSADANINTLRVKNTASADTTHWDFYSGEDSGSFSATAANNYLAWGYNAFATLNKATASRNSALTLVNEDNTANSHQALLLAVLANHGAGTKAWVPAVQADAYSLGAGNTTSLMGLSTYVEQAGSGTVAGAFGLYVGANVDSGAGSITDNYGVFVDAQTAGGTNNWAIKTAGTARSQFGGPVDTDTGYRISNGAASGNYLRGNGANFISSAIQAGDLGSGYIDGLADFAAALCGTNELLLDGGGSWSCLATTGSGNGVRATSPTNVTLSVEDTGNAITTVSKITLVAAGCNNATAGPGFDLPTSNAPVPACLGTSPHRLGSLDFSDGATQTAVTHFRLPGDWTGSVDVAFLFTGDTASSNNIRWQVSSACVADSEDLLNPTYNTASASNTAGPATAGQRRSVSFSSVSMSNCSASETVFWKFERVGGDAGDTYTGLARLLEVELTLRRAQ